MRNLVLLAEDALLPFAALAIVLRFALSPRRGLLRALSRELPQRLGRAPGGPAPIWVHAASAGEVAAASPLVERLAGRPSHPAVLLTTTTAAGRDRALETPGVSAAGLAPLDFGWAVARFLKTVRPSVVVLVETELWPHLIELSRDRGARVVLVNGRVSPRSFARYRLVRPLLAPFLARLELVCAQTEDDASRFRALGAGNVVVTGNLKYDRLRAADPKPAENALERLGWGQSRVITAASTHPGEEEQVIAAFLEARKRAPGLRLVLAPRHVERAADAVATARRFGLKTARWSRPEELAPQADALVLDTLGVLASFFPHSFASFVGGTLVPVGGHNVLEPALAGCPVLFGPHTEHTAQTARLLESAGAAFCAEDGARLAQLLVELVGDPARAQEQGRLARKTAESLRGAAGRTLAWLEPVLSARGL